MIRPEYLDQVVISNRAGADGRAGWRRPSFASTFWAVQDLLSAVLAGLLAYDLRFHWHMSQNATKGSLLAHVAPMHILMILLIFGSYLVLFSQLFGLYRPSESSSGLHEQRMTAQACLTASLLLCGTLFLMRDFGVSRFVVLVTMLLTGVLLMTRRALWRRLRHRRHLRGLEVRNVLIVGDGRVGHALRNHLEALPHLGFRFKGFISMHPAVDPAGKEVNPNSKETSTGSKETNPNIVGDLRNCVAVARSLFVDEIYFSTPADKHTVVTVVDDARAMGIDVRVVPDLYDGLAWHAPVEYVGQFPTIPLHRREFPRGAFLIKRAIDVVLALAVLVLVSPIMLVIAIMVRLDSPGTILYGAERIGRKGRVFQCFKFRTMVPNAERMKKQLAHLNEREGILFKMTNDPRITKIGVKLRKYSLDELPQLFNVIKGDMSLVGPRPPLAVEVEKYHLSHLRRLDVLPGITGLWQVEARQDPSFDSYISLDTAYVENWTLLLDLQILARTIGVVVGGTGS